MFIEFPDIYFLKLQLKSIILLILSSLTRKSNHFFTVLERIFIYCFFYPANFFPMLSNCGAVLLKMLFYDYYLIYCLNSYCTAFFFYLFSYVNTFFSRSTFASLNMPTIFVLDSVNFLVIVFTMLQILKPTVSGYF